MNQKYSVKQVKERIEVLKKRFIEWKESQTTIDPAEMEDKLTDLLMLEYMWKLRQKYIQKLRIAHKYVPDKVRKQMYRMGI